MGIKELNFGPDTHSLVFKVTMEEGPIIALTSASPIKVEALTECYHHRIETREVVGRKEQPLGHDGGLMCARLRLVDAGEERGENALLSIESYLDLAGRECVVVCNEREYIRYESNCVAPDFERYLQENERDGLGCNVTYSQWVGKEPWMGRKKRLEMLREAVYRWSEGIRTPFHSRITPDFPKRRIFFKHLWINEYFGSMVSDMVVYLRPHVKPRTVLLAADARGFLIAPVLALELGVSVELVRKEGKLPPPTVSIEYEKEYGSDRLCIAQSAGRNYEHAIIVDDVVATGGTLEAMRLLAERVGLKVICAFAPFIVEPLWDEAQKRVGCPIISPRFD